MKQDYTVPELEIISFDSEDVITTSILPEGDSFADLPAK